MHEGKERVLDCWWWNTECTSNRLPHTAEKHSKYMSENYITDRSETLNHHLWTRQDINSDVKYIQE